MVLWKKIVYYWATLSNAVANVRLMAAVDEIQKHSKSGEACFKDWPALEDTCGIFVKGELCSGKSCPLRGVLGLYVKANARHEKTHNAVQQAQTKLLCAVIKDREQ